MRQHENKIKWIAGILVLLVIAGCIYSSRGSIAAYVEGLTASESLTKEQRLADFDYMYEILEENYPFFWVNERVNHVDWLSKKEEYREQVAGARSEGAFKRVLRSILFDLHNGHTEVVLDRRFYIYMYEAYMADKAANAPWLEVLREPAAQKHYNYKVPESISGPSADNPASRAVGNNIKTEIIEPGKAAYLQVRTMDTFCIDGDRKKLYSFFQSIKDYKALIIDIRGNGGGDTDYWSDLIVQPLIDKEARADFYYLSRGGDYGESFYDHRLTEVETLETAALAPELLAKFPPEVKDNFRYCKIAPTIIKPQNPVGFKGKIFLLVDRYVYSSAEAFAAFCKQSGFATIIGERTGGDGVAIDPMVAVLPNSGYVIRFSSVLGLNPDGTANEEVKTTPDIVVEDVSIRSFKSDKCIQEALRNIQ